MKSKLLALCFIPALVLSETVPTLTETNGVVLAGKIVAYSPQSDSVTIKTTNGPLQRPVSAFVADSQATILLWRVDKDFLKDSKLTAAFSPDYTSTSSNVLGTVTFDGMVQSNRMIGTATRSYYVCTLTLSNKSEFTFNDLQVEYRVFFKQSLTGNFVGKYQLSGRLDSAALNPGSAWEFSTTPVLASISYRSAAMINWVSPPHEATSEIMGILLRVRKKGVSGEWIERLIEHGAVPSERDRQSYQKIYKNVYDGD